MFNFLLEKSVSQNRFEKTKEFKKSSYEEVKTIIESMLGKCRFQFTDVESPYTLVKPHSTNDEYILTCLE